MSLLDDCATSIKRKQMVLFFIVDTSGGMKGSKIGSVNEAVRQVIPELRQVSDDNTNAEIKVAVLTFSNGAKWITQNGPVDVEHFNWTQLDAQGVVDLGAACKELNIKLSKKSFMREPTQSYGPVLLLISNGGPTDDWLSALNSLKQNNWYKAAAKVAIAIGDDADKDVLKAFTGSIESVIDVRNSTALMEAIKFVSVRASQVMSRGAGVDSDFGAKQQEVNELISEYTKEKALCLDHNDEDDNIW